MHKFKAGSQVAQREFLGNHPNVVVSVLKQQHIHQKLATEFFIIWRHRLVFPLTALGVLWQGERKKDVQNGAKAVGGRRAFCCRSWSDQSESVKLLATIYPAKKRRSTTR